MIDHSIFADLTELGIYLGTRSVLIQIHLWHLNEVVQSRHVSLDESLFPRRRIQDDHIWKPKASTLVRPKHDVKQASAMMAYQQLPTLRTIHDSDVAPKEKTMKEAPSPDVTEDKIEKMTMMSHESTATPKPRELRYSQR